MSHDIFNADRILKRNRLVAEGLCDSELTRQMVLILCEQGCEAAVEHVKFGILTEGCATLCVNMPLLCDISAEGAGKNSFMHARESIADITESILSMHSADGVAIIASSQAAAAGMLMGALRHNIPLAFLPAFFIGAYYPSSVRIAKARACCGKTGIDTLEDVAYGIRCGRSMEMDNLNSICVFLEGCGFAPHNSVGAHTQSEKISAARECGRMAAFRAINLSYPRKDLSSAAIDCGLIAYITAGGTAAALLDVLAIANENNINIDLKYIESLSAKLPRLAAIAPFSRFNIAAFSKAGGVLALLKEAAKIPKMVPSSVKILDKFLVDLLTEAEIKRGTINPRGSNGMCLYSGGAFGTNFNGEFEENSRVSRGASGDDANVGIGVDVGRFGVGIIGRGFEGFECEEVLGTLENPISNEGGFGILKGNMIDYGVFSRGIKDKIFKGTAAVFDSEEQLRAAILNGSIGGQNTQTDGNVAIVLRGQGAKDNGMPLLDLHSAVIAAELNNALIITDGRVIESGGCITISLCFGEELAAVKSGDPIEIDFKKCKINLDVAGKEINSRLKKLKNINESLSGGLLRYASLVGEPSNGCILRQKF